MRGLIAPSFFPVMTFLLYYILKYILKLNSYSRTDGLFSDIATIFYFFHVIRLYSFTQERSSNIHELIHKINTLCTMNI